VFKIISYSYADHYIQISLVGLIIRSCDRIRTIYLPDYLDEVLSELTNTSVDLFIELPYYADKSKPMPKRSSTILSNIKYLFEPCFKSLTDKYECKRLYPNVRFYAIDIRHFNELMSGFQSLSHFRKCDKPT
jgi:hypothetical protein